MRVLNLATCQGLSRQYVTWHPMPNAPEISMAWESASTTEGVEESDAMTALDVDVSAEQLNNSTSGSKGELKKRPDQPTTEPQAAPAALRALAELADHNVSA